MSDPVGPAPAPSLRAATATGMLWSGVSLGGRIAVAWIATFVLSRLLGPDLRGLVGNAAILLTFVTLLAELGLAAAVVQLRDADDELLSTIFWLNAGAGAALAGLTVLAAPWAAAFYDEPRLTAVLRALAVVPLLLGLGAVPQALLERGLRFRTLARRELAATVLGAVAGIGGALAGWGAWSLVAQTLVSTGIATVLVAVSCGWRPRLAVRLRRLREVREFSLNLAAFGVVNYFGRTIDDHLVSVTWGRMHLAWYQHAYMVILEPLRVVSAVVARVLFPALAKVQDDVPRLRAAYVRVLSLIALAMFPVIVLAAALADDFVLAVLGEEWMPTAPMMRILAPVAMLQVLGTTVGVLYQVRRATPLMLRMGLAGSAVLVAGIVAGSRWGVQGVAAGYAVAAVLWAVPAAVVPFRLVDLRLKDVGRAVMRPFACSVLALLAALAGARWATAGAPALLAGGAAGTLAYLAATLALNRSAALESRDLLRLARSG